MYFNLPDRQITVGDQADAMGFNVLAGLGITQDPVLPHPAAMYHRRLSGSRFPQWGEGRLL